MNKLAIVAVSLIAALSGVAPANAFPAMGPSAFQNSDIVQVRDDHHHNNNNWRRHGGRGGNYSHDRGYYGHDHHGNGGAIIGGLAAGAIIGGIIAGSRSNAGSSHAQSCYNRYRSYRASDNTYQPNSGPRVQCR
jgi:hypothetical protein